MAAQPYFLSASLVLKDFETRIVFKELLKHLLNTRRLLFPYILNVDLQFHLVVIEVFGKLVTLMIESEHSLKEGEHLQGERQEEPLVHTGEGEAGSQPALGAMQTERPFPNSAMSMSTLPASPVQGTQPPPCPEIKQFQRSH